MKVGKNLYESQTSNSIKNKNKTYMTTKTIDELLEPIVVYKLVEEVEIGPGFPRPQGTYLTLRKESFETERECENYAKSLVENELFNNKVYTVKCTTSYDLLHQFYLK